jgi:hypothetical protein
MMDLMEDVHPNRLLKAERPKEIELNFTRNSDGLGIRLQGGDFGG